MVRVNIQGYQKLTLLDYPERVACTVFTGGCNLRCPFCHNAGLVKTPLAYTSAEKDVLQYLSTRKGLLDGVCVTGGEPLLQPDLQDFLQRIKEMGFLVKLDTNGSLPQKLSALLQSGVVDYVAMDIKSSPDGYAKAVGLDVDFSAFERSIEMIRNSGIAYEFRTTAVKGIHTPSDFVEIGKRLGDVERYFIQGFVDSGNLLGSDCSAFTEEEMQNLLQAIIPFTPRARLRGIS